MPEPWFGVSTRRPSAEQFADPARPKSRPAGAVHAVACGAKGRVARGGCLEGDGSRNEAHPRRSVFVGEMDTNISLLAPYAYPFGGEKCVRGVPGLASLGSEHHRGAFGMTIEGMGSCLAVEGATARAAVSGHVSEGLGACLMSGTDRGDGQPQRPSRIGSGS